LLRKRIISHEYPPGFRFDLNFLESQLGISRTPLKDALQRLEIDGLVIIRPRRGTFVATIDVEEVAETFAIRRLLELYAAEVVGREASDKEIESLKALVVEMNSLLANNEYQSIVEEYIRIDHDFHKLLVELARNKLLVEIYKKIDAHVQISRVRQKFNRSDSMHTESEHQAILEALEQRDVKALVNALGSHIDQSRIRMLKAIEDQENG
jgi:DNA-binding GntR family transcriptional regulator